MCMTVIKIKERRTDYQITEAFRTIRTNLRFCGRDKKVIAVTSCIPNEGKSSVSVLLAQALREEGARVVLVDADLRKSVMFQHFFVEGEGAGLSDYLSGQSSMKDVMHSTDMENFDIIMSGISPPNPTELLRTQEFTRMLGNLREMYDYILVDTPPIGLVIDAAVIAEACDGILWVVSSGQISRQMANVTMRQLEKSGCPVLGAVLNKVDMKRSGQNTYYSGGYYRQYGDHCIAAENIQN